LSHPLLLLFFLLPALRYCQPPLRHHPQALKKPCRRSLALALAVSPSPSHRPPSPRSLALALAPSPLPSHRPPCPRRVALASKLLLTNPEGNHAAAKLRLPQATASLPRPSVPVNIASFRILSETGVEREPSPDISNESSDEALFLHTSGIINRPKGVPLTQFNLAAHVNGEVCIFLLFFSVHVYIAAMKKSRELLQGRTRMALVLVLRYLGTGATPCYWKTVVSFDGSILNILFKERHVKHCSYTKIQMDKAWTFKEAFSLPSTEFLDGAVKVLKGTTSTRLLFLGYLRSKKRKIHSLPALL
ncbi:hypothetical protein Taro_047885, partial [Colocasia esculenta]|nr:hypothetical protein [Colocasia esculenta]